MKRSPIIGKRLIKKLSEFVKRSEELQSVPYDQAVQEIFDDEVKGFVHLNFGAGERKVIAVRLTMPARVIGYGTNVAAVKQRDRIDCLSEISNRLLTLQARVERGDHSLPEPDAPAPRKPATVADSTQMFISHSGETPAFYRLERFVRDLGITPIVAEWIPFKGRAVPENARAAMDVCQAAIVFATSADQVGKRAQPGRGALIETGILQERFGQRVIYLVEEGVEFGPMADNFACESFTQDCLERAFHRIIIELRAHGLT